MVDLFLQLWAAYWHYGVVAITVLVLVAMAMPWYLWHEGCHKLKRQKEDAARLHADYLQLDKEVKQLRGQVTEGRTLLKRIEDARKNLEGETGERQKDLQSWRDQFAELEKKYDAVCKDLAEEQNKKFELEEQVKSVTEERERRVKELKEKAEKAGEEARGYQEKATRLDWRVRQVSQCKGRIWETPVQTSLEFQNFRKRTGADPRHAVIISMMNLKGGVGKSTIGANLGAVLWKEFDKRVLLVDLDFQASLTSLCLKPDDIAGLREESAFIQRLFNKEGAEYEELYHCWKKINRDDPRCKCDLLATDEDLANWEEQLMMHWLIGETDDDIRFRLRRLLHSDMVHERFDYIILDCPPRNTTASVNALAASDYVMVPVLLDHTSAAGVPRLLGMLRRMKENKEVPICPEIDVLGVVANRVIQDGRLTSMEDEEWKKLDRLCKDSWGSSVHRFARGIPDRTDIGRAAARHEPAAFNSVDLHRVFLELGKEVESRVMAAEGTKTAKEAGKKPEPVSPFSSQPMRSLPPPFVPIGAGNGPPSSIGMPPVSNNPSGAPTYIGSPAASFTPQAPAPPPFLGGPPPGNLGSSPYGGGPPPGPNPPPTTLPGGPFAGGPRPPHGNNPPPPPIHYTQRPTGKPKEPRDRPQ